MPVVKAVLGNVRVDTAKRKRACSRHRSGKRKHDIVTGDTCLVVTDADGSKHNYCHESAAEILDRAAKDLDDLRRGMDAE